MVADEIARRRIAVVVKPPTNVPTFETLGATLENAAWLSAAGVTLALATFDTHNSRNLRQEAGNAVAYGMNPEAALRAVTLTPAQLWGVADRVGSLEPGKDADVVVWSGDPFELSTTAEHVFVKGREMPNDTRQRLLFERYRDIRSVPRQAGAPPHGVVSTARAHSQLPTRVSCEGSHSGCGVGGRQSPPTATTICCQRATPAEQPQHLASAPPMYRSLPRMWS